jgi:hypothetical protein
LNRRNQMITTTADLDSELLAAEQLAAQLRGRKAQRVQSLRYRLADLNQRLTALSVPSKEPDANDDPTVAALREQFWKAGEALRVCERRYLLESLSERSKPGFQERHDKEQARLRDAALAAERQYISAVETKTKELHQAFDAARHQNTIDAAELRREIASVEAELARSELARSS